VVAAAELLDAAGEDVEAAEEDVDDIDEEDGVYPPAGPHEYISSLFPAPQYSPGNPSQGMLQSESATRVLPLLIWFPQ